MTRDAVDPAAGLARGDELAQSALAALPELAVAVFDRGMRCVLADGGALRTHGYVPGELEGRLVADVLPPAVFERWQPHLRAALEGRGSRLDHRSVDGTRVYDVHVGPVEVGGEVVGGVVVARDVADRSAAEAARELAEREFRTAFDDAPIGMSLVAPDGSFLRVNEALCEIVGHAAAELLEMTYQEVTHPDDRDADVALAEALLAGRRRAYQLEKRYVRADGTPVWVLLAVSLVRDDAGEPLYFISQVQDLSEHKRLESQLRRLATEDDLTGLSNRRYFERELDRQLRRSRRHGEPAALLVLDLDNFKDVNDTLGHHAGDAVLQHVAAVLRRRLRASDTVARLGGDEFAVLLPYLSAGQASRVADALDADLRRAPLPIDGTAVPVVASIGVTALDPELGVDDALRAADRAMYGVKGERRRGGAAGA